jgi:hypothetical protein
MPSKSADVENERQYEARQLGYLPQWIPDLKERYGLKLVGG